MREPNRRLTRYHQAQGENRDRTLTAVTPPLTLVQATIWNQTSAQPFTCPLHPAQTLQAADLDGAATWTCRHCRTHQPLLASDAAEISTTTLLSDEQPDLFVQDPPLPPTQARGQISPGTILVGYQSRSGLMPWFLDAIDLGRDLRTAKYTLLTLAIMTGLYFTVLGQHIPALPYFLSVAISTVIIAGPACGVYALLARHVSPIDDRTKTPVVALRPGQWISAKNRHPTAGDLAAYAPYALQVAQTVRIGRTDHIRIALLNGHDLDVKDRHDVTVLELHEPGLVQG